MSSPSAHPPERPRLVTVGHGTLPADDLAALLRDAGVDEVVDVRTAPGSRRHPQFARAALEQWLPQAGVGYRWEPRLGGFRKAKPDSDNVALRHPGFRGYADHMRTADFGDAFEELLDQARRQHPAAMCSETLWWRCHRRLLSDAAVLLGGAEVLHLGHDGRFTEHQLTDGARRDGDRVVYDAGATSFDLDS